MFLNRVNMKFYFFYFALIPFVFQAFAQQESIDSTAVKAKTIVDDFNEIIDKSGTYQEYKVVKKTSIANFRKQLSEKKASFENEIHALEGEISKQKDQIENLKRELNLTQNALSKVQEEKDSMQFFGNNLNKSIYQSIVFGLIGFLVFILIILIIKFKSNSVATKEAKEALERTDKSFEDYKRNALEKQQKLGRQLQDEKNKVNKLKTGGPK